MSERDQIIAEEASREVLAKERADNRERLTTALGAAMYFAQQVGFNRLTAELRQLFREYTGDVDPF